MIRFTEEPERVALPLYHGPRLLSQALPVSHRREHDRDKLVQPLDFAQSRLKLQHGGATNQDVSDFRASNCQRGSVLRPKRL